MPKLDFGRRRACPTPVDVILGKPWPDSLEKLHDGAYSPAPREYKGRFPCVDPMCICLTYLFDNNLPLNTKLPLNATCSPRGATA